jgi:hypothetical protein
MNNLTLRFSNRIDLVVSNSMSLRCLSPIVSQSFTTASFSYQQQHFQDATCQIKSNPHKWIYVFSVEKYGRFSALNPLIKRIVSVGLFEIKLDLNAEMDIRHPRQRKKERFQDP